MSAQASPVSAKMTRYKWVEVPVELIRDDFIAAAEVDRVLAERDETIAAWTCLRCTHQDGTDLRPIVAKLEQETRALREALARYSDWLDQHNEGADRVVAEKLREIMTEATR